MRQVFRQMRRGLQALVDRVIRTLSRDKTVLFSAALPLFASAIVTPTPIKHTARITATLPRHPRHGHVHWACHESSTLHSYKIDKFIDSHLQKYNRSSESGKADPPRLRRIRM